MKEYHLHLNVIEFPPSFKRGELALILLKNSSGQYVLGNKDIYPKGISRIVGGGIETGEDPATAAARELQEETGLVAQPKDLTGLARVEARITNATDEHVTFITHVFFYNLGEQIITPQDDVKSAALLDEERYFELLHRYENLPKTLDEKFGFAWFDYGQLYAFIHRLAINEVRHLDS